ncbi:MULTISPECIES: hypothetical protein [Bacillus]|uniref:hypothetical protein n=1 Tax=Bacillus TaxID=1386 RepID=UPI000BB70D1E|nr:MULTISPECIES: hypothetical protein [Bacillus]
MKSISKSNSKIRYFLLLLMYLIIVSLVFYSTPSMTIFMLCLFLITIYFIFLYYISLKEGMTLRKRIPYVFVTIFTALLVNWLLGSPIKMHIVIIAVTSTAIASHIEQRKNMEKENTYMEKENT